MRISLVLETRTWMSPKDCCKIRYAGGATWGYDDCGQQCPMTFSTGLSWASYVGGPAGFSQMKPTNSAPAFCACDKIYDSDPNVRKQCTSTSFTTYQCYYARDDLFPPLNGNPPFGLWKAIT